MTKYANTMVVRLCVVAAITNAVAGAAFLLIAVPAAATTKFAQETGQPCAACHVRPDGGRELTPFGKEFQANGNKLPKSRSRP
jgi:hypothetical protein